jgi:hypothetical protein
MATYSTFRHTTWRVQPSHDQPILLFGVWGYWWWPIPLLRSRLSPACARGAPLRNPLRGGSGWCGIPGRMNNVFSLSRVFCARLFKSLKPQPFDRSSWQLLVANATPWAILTVGRPSAIGKRLFYLPAVPFSCIFCLGHPVDEQKGYVLFRVFLARQSSGREYVQATFRLRTG